MQNANDIDALTKILLDRDDEGHESWNLFHANLAQAVLNSDWLRTRDTCVKAEALEEAIAIVTDQRDESHHDPELEESHAYLAHREGRYLGKTVALKLLRARAAEYRERAAR